MIAVGDLAVVYIKGRPWLLPSPPKPSMVEVAA